LNFSSVLNLTYEKTAQFPPWSTMEKVNTEKFELEQNRHGTIGKLKIAKRRYLYGVFEFNNCITKDTCEPLPRRPVIWPACLPGSCLVH
jgi:hypothetical protein